MQIPLLQVLVFHRTDTHIQVLSVALVLSINNKQTCYTEFSVTLKAKVGSTLTKDAVLRINLNVDGVSFTSKTHTHPSHSETSRLLTSSLSLGVPVPRGTQYIRDVQISHIYFLVFHHTDTNVGLVFSSHIFYSY